MTQQEGELTELTNEVLRFRDEREWKKFHNVKDLALSLSLEASEVLEFMQWKNGAELETAIREQRSKIGAELADVLYWTLLLAHETGVDLKAAFREKMAENAAKYPVQKAKGSSRKYKDL